MVIAKRKRLSFHHPDPTWPLPDGYAWYALVSDSGRESRRAAWLEGMGLFAFYPLETRWRSVLVPRMPITSAPPRRGKNRRKMVLEKRESYQVPLIPGLILIGANGPIPWLDILSNEIHRVRVIGCFGTPYPISRDGALKLQAMSVAVNGKSPASAYRVGGMAIVSGIGNRIVEIDKLPKGRWQLVRQCFDTPSSLPAKTLVAAQSY